MKYGPHTAKINLASLGFDHYGKKTIRNIFLKTFFKKMSILFWTYVTGVI